MPSDQELSKLSDEHKAMLAQKCVQLLMRGRVGAGREEMAEVHVLSALQYLHVCMYMYILEW